MSDPSSIQAVHYLKEISDHKVILAYFQSSFQTEKPKRKQIKLYDKGNYERFTAQLEESFPFFEQSFRDRSVD